MKDFSKATQDPFEGEEESPRPWVLSKDDNSGLFEIHTKIGTLVCTVARQVPEKRGDWTLNRTIPNAMLIVTAVNNFDKMKEALEKLVMAAEYSRYHTKSAALDPSIETAKQLLESIK